YFQDNVNQHAAQSDKDPTAVPTVSIGQHVKMSNTTAQKSTDGCFNVDVPTTSTSKSSTLEDYPDFTMTQIIALDPILNATTTPNVQTRHKNVGKKATYFKVKNTFPPQMDFGVVKLGEFFFFHIMSQPDRPWEDGAKYSQTVTFYSTVDCWFMAWIDNIEKQWRQSECDMRCISPDHDVGQCIRGFKLLANIPWDRVDEVIIPVNISNKLH
ncbi:hypothetical protein EJD97_002434, partial [Solanum chilense]